MRPDVSCFTPSITTIECHQPPTEAGNQGVIDTHTHTHTTLDSRVKSVKHEADSMAHKEARQQSTGQSRQITPKYILYENNANHTLTFISLPPLNIIA